MISTYDIALKMEKEGHFFVAYPLFKECLNSTDYELGDILFHCGWCVENIKIADKRLALDYYTKAVDEKCNTICKMNGYFRAGWIQMHFKNYSEAIRFYTMAIKEGHSEGEFNSIYSNAIYWCAVSLEASKRFLDAINLYRAVRDTSTDLNPESRYREMVSLISIGKYSEALYLCKSFDQFPPAGFSEERYSELKELVEKEKNLLEYCFTEEKYTSN